MTGNQFYIDGRLYRFDYSGAGPPWPLRVWHDDLQVWENVAAPDGAAAPGSLLVRLPSRIHVISADWLTSPDGVAVLTAAGDGISCDTPAVVDLPDFVLTTQADVISVVGR